MGRCRRRRGNERERVGLPQELSSFVGRTRELAAVEASLGHGRLVTLVGPGGCGKTRLAIRAARTFSAHDSCDVRLVELASLGDGGLVAATVAQAVGSADRAGRTPVDIVVDGIGDQRLLLVLDNCEHLLEDVSSLVVAVLERCPAVRVLATSRQRLGLAGEALFPVPPLALPGAPEETTAAIARSEAVTLFVERAAAVEPSFRLDEGNAPAIADICARLDGIPLAIELAAARSGALSLGTIAEHLDRADEGDGERGVLRGQRHRRPRRRRRPSSFRTQGCRCGAVVDVAPGDPGGGSRPLPHQRSPDPRRILAVPRRTRRVTRRASPSGCSVRIQRRRGEPPDKAWSAPDYGEEGVGH